MKQRDTSLDIIRLLACFMVVVMHSPLPSANANGQFLVALSYFTAPCIGLFFMVSGALLLPVKTDYFTFLRRRFGKVAVPTVVWSLIYIALQLYYSKSEINVLQAVASIPFSAQGEGVLWFMYTLCGLYLLAPILSGWLERATKREVEFVLLLWAVTLCYPLLRLSKRLRYRPALLLRRLCRIFPPRLLSSALSRQHIGMAKRRPGSGGRDSALCHKKIWNRIGLLQRVLVSVNFCSSTMCGALEYCE